MVRVATIPLPPVDRGEALRYAGCRRPGPADLELLESCLVELGDRLRGRVCWETYPVIPLGGGVDLGFARTGSRDLTRRLAGCGTCVLFAATVGLEMDRLIARYGGVSPARSLFFQAIGAERIEALCDTFCRQMADDLARQGRGVTVRFSPGYGDVPLGLQSDIFRVLDCPRKIGLTLNESLLMSPSKSVTAVFGVTDRPEGDCAGAGCADCGKQDCVYRE